MQTLRNKAALLRQIKNATTSKGLHEILYKRPEIAKAARKKIGLAYNPDENTYIGLKDLDGVTVSVKYDLACLKNDLSVLVKDF